MAKIVTYKCPYCENRFNKQDLIEHVEDEHHDEIPEGFTAFRLVFNYVNKKPLSYHGKCTECGGPTPWDENKGRYDRQCGKKTCHDSYVKKFEENMMKTRGVTRISATKDGLVKMLNSRKISGVYKFQDGGEKSYCGSYEKNTLEFMDKVLNIKSADIMSPGPILEYRHEDKTHLYITDFYYQPYNLIIEVKDGGDNPNKRNMPEYRQKQIEKERYIIKNTNYNYLRLTNNDLKQLVSTFCLLKLQMVENTGERVIQVNESLLLEKVVDNKIKESDVSSPYFVYGSNGVPNCCVAIKGFDKPMRARSTMIPLRVKDNNWEIYAKKNSKDDTFLYSFPGGGWDPNEDPQDAAIRETQEEARINIKDPKYCGYMIEYSDKVADWVKENIPNDKWWYGYYSKIYAGLFKSKYTGKIADVDKDPEMLSGEWYVYDEIKDKIFWKHKKAVDYYINSYGTSESNPIHEYMNALMSGKVVGLKDSDSYIINYLPKGTFVNEDDYDEILDNSKIGLTNGTFSSILYIDPKDNILKTSDKIFEVADLKHSAFYETNKSVSEVSNIFRNYLGTEVSENFIYSRIVGKPLYTKDEIPFVLKEIKESVNIPDMVRSYILEDNKSELNSKIDSVLESTKEAIINGSI